jgi:hypothetical protein
MSLDILDDDLMPTLVEDAMAYSVLTKYARSGDFVPKKNVPAYAPTAVESGPVDRVI